MTLRSIVGALLLLLGGPGTNRLGVVEAWRTASSGTSFRPRQQYDCHRRCPERQPLRPTTKTIRTTNNLPSFKATSLKLFSARFGTDHNNEHDQSEVVSPAFAGRRSFLSTCAAAVAAVTLFSPATAWADGAPASPPKPAAPAPAPAPKPPAPALPLDEKAKAEAQAKRRVQQEVAKEEAQLMKRAVSFRDKEVATKRTFDRLTKSKNFLENKVKALAEAKVAAQKLDTRLQGAGSRTRLEKDLEHKEKEAKVSLMKKQRELRAVEKRLKQIKTKLFEVEALYRLKVGKEIVLPPPKGSKDTKKSTIEKEGVAVRTLYAVFLGGSIAIGAYLNNRRGKNNDDDFFGGFGGGRYQGTNRDNFGNDTRGYGGYDRGFGSGGYDSGAYNGGGYDRELGGEVYDDGVYREIDVI